MKRRKLLWRIYPYFFLIIAVSLAISAWYASREIENLYLNETRQTLEGRARIILEQMDEALLDNDAAAIAQQCRQLGSLTDTRITVMDSSGEVLGDSHEDPTTMENHASRPEVRVALSRDVGMATRYSNTLQQSLMYVAIPYVVDDQIKAIVRTSRPLTIVQDTLQSLYIKLIIAGLTLIALATIVSFIVFRRLTYPLEDLIEGARRIARGDFSVRLGLSDTVELAEVAHSMNTMARDLESRIRTILQQRNEREAIFASMSEGVVAIDTDERIVTMNRAAATLLGLSGDRSIGESLLGVVRIPVLNDLIDEIAGGADMAEAEIVLPGRTEKHFQTHAAALKDESGERIGIVFVFNDISKLKRLEQMRSEFVANVSHELKTPITAITASTETLLDSEFTEADDSRRFLEIILKHARRLNALVEDLLALARIKSETDQGHITLSRHNLSSVLRSAADSRQEFASHHKVEIVCESDDEIVVDLNADQFDKAVTNLLDNSIKYSDPGGTVFLRGYRSADEVVVEVEDHGCGIAAKHLPRLFERFYRVDSARTRDTGGTGLGLALVKHITLAHDGRVTVDSQVGEGSTFRIFLPSTESA